MGLTSFKFNLLDGAPLADTPRVRLRGFPALGAATAPKRALRRPRAGRAVAECGVPAAATRGQAESDTRPPLRCAAPSPGDADNSRLAHPGTPRRSE